MFLLKNVGLLIRKTTEDGRTKLMGIDERARKFPTV